MIKANKKKCNIISGEWNLEQENVCGDRARLLGVINYVLLKAQSLELASGD